MRAGGAGDTGRRERSRAGCQSPWPARRGGGHVKGVDSRVRRHAGATLPTARARPAHPPPVPRLACRMAWRSASQLARSESTSTPSQSSTRYRKYPLLLVPLAAAPAVPLPAAAAAAAAAAGAAPSPLLHTAAAAAGGSATDACCSCAASPATAAAASGAAPLPPLLPPSMRGWRMPVRAAGGRGSIVSSLERCSWREGDELGGQGESVHQSLPHVLGALWGDAAL